MAITINGTGTITGISAGGLPDAIITQPELATGVAGTGPAFSAYLASAQTVTTATFTKAQINTEEFDTNGNYDNATNYRFTPTVAGYYQISGQIGIAATTAITGSCIASIYKNGARFKDGNFTSAAASGTGFYSVVSALINFNGSTDYVELYGLATGTGTLTFTVNTGTVTWFQGVLVRST
jgi:hypothetical protein